MKVLVHNDAQKYTLLLDEATGDAILSVLCGRVLMYGVEAKLTPEQFRTYQEEGPTVLSAYARQVYEEEDRKLLEQRRLSYEADHPSFLAIFARLPWWHRAAIVFSSLFLLCVLGYLFLRQFVP